MQMLREICQQHTAEVLIVKTHLNDVCVLYIVRPQMDQQYHVMLESVTWGRISDCIGYVHTLRDVCIPMVTSMRCYL